MRFYKVFLVGVVAAGVAAWCLAPGAMGGSIVGTDHDFSSQSWTTEVCNVCHTPHKADTSVTDAPLWNHEVTTATFTTYDSATLTATVGQPDGISKLCLSCHDGTVAIDSFGGATGENSMTGDAKLGTDLSGSHPISFTYDTTLATNDGGLHDPSTTASGITTSGKIADDMLFNGKLECGSCHDPHDNANGDFLIKSNSNSALCLTCHDK